MTAGRDITIKSGECGRRKNMAKYVFGVDVGGTTVKMGLFTVEGELLDKWEIKTRTEDGGKNVLPDIADSIKEVIESKKLAKEDVEGVGIGVPGPVKEDGTVLKCVNLGWGILNVEDELEKLVGYPVKAGNDANVAALGEMWQGGGKGHSNLVMVTLGTGVGGGIILNGKMLFGVNGAGGEIGHICVDDSETETCGCGNKGCLEQYTSATGVVRLAGRAMAASDKKSTLRELEAVTAKDVFDAAKAGDELALEIVDTQARILGRALAQIACVVDPEIFVIGGGVSNACHEGAIGMVNGKAKLLRDDYCDGLGDCLPSCPTGAITFVEREAAAYDEAAVMANKQARLDAEKSKNMVGSGVMHEKSPAHSGCPGSMARSIFRRPAAASGEAVQASSYEQAAVECVQNTTDKTVNQQAGDIYNYERPSQLTQWPVQIKLAPVNAPYFDGAKLLIAADCTAYAYASFHEKFIKGHVTLIGCPKLDSVDYSEKLTEIIRRNDIQSVTIVRMEVPCCGGLEMAAKKALQDSGKFIPWQVATISIDGRILD
jgi:glucokinase